MQATAVGKLDSPRVFGHRVGNPDPWLGNTPKSCIMFCMGLQTLQLWQLLSYYPVEHKVFVPHQAVILYSAEADLCLRLNVQATRENLNV